MLSYMYLAGQSQCWFSIKSYLNWKGNFVVLCAELNDRILDNLVGNESIKDKILSSSKVWMDLHFHRFEVGRIHCEFGEG